MLHASCASDRYGRSTRSRLLDVLRTIPFHACLLIGTSYTYLIGTGSEEISAQKNMWPKRGLDVPDGPEKVRYRCCSP